MNHLRKYFGLLWMLLGPASITYLFMTASAEIAKKPVLDTKIQWAVFVGIFVPIAIGMSLFGWYAWKREYDDSETTPPVE